MGATSLSLFVGCFSHVGVSFLADQVLVVGTGTGTGGFSDNSSPAFDFFIHEGVCLLTAQVFAVGTVESFFDSASLASPAAGFAHDGGAEKECRLGEWADFSCSMAVATST